MSELTDKKTLKKLKELEAIFILENSSVEENKLLDFLKINSVEKLTALIAKKNQIFADSNSVLYIAKKQNRYELFINKKFNSPVLERYQAKKKELSQSLLETLAIVAYNQPVTKVEIDAIRGINSTPYLKSLIEEKLIYIAGKKKAPGRPSLFKTTENFLLKFGLVSLKDLPPLEDVKNYAFLS